MKWPMYLLLYSTLIFLIRIGYEVVVDEKESISFFVILISMNVLSIIAVGDYYNNRRNSFKWITLFLGLIGITYFYKAIDLIIFQEFEFWSGRGAFIFNSSYNLFGLKGPFVLYVLFACLIFYIVYLFYKKQPNSIFFINNNH